MTSEEISMGDPKSDHGANRLGNLFIWLFLWAIGFLATHRAFSEKQYALAILSFFCLLSFTVVTGQLDRSLELLEKLNERNERVDKQPEQK